MPDFPKHLKRGSCKVTIYGPTAGDARFRVNWRQNAKRRERKFNVYADAEAFAKDTLAKLDAGAMPAISLTQDQVSEFVQAYQAASGEGYGLLAAIQEWRIARRQLPSGHSLADAVKAYGEKRVTATMPVSDLVDLYLAEQTKKLTGGYLRQTKAVLTRLRDAINLDVSDLQNHHLISFLDARKVSDKTRANYSGILSGMISWAIKHGHLPAETSLRYALRSSYKPRTLTVSFYTPDEFRSLLGAAPTWLQNRLALVGLCGVRVEESLRTTAEDLKNGHLAIGADKAKTGRRRLVELPGNLQARLEADPTFRAPIDSVRYQKSFKRTLTATGVPSKRNGLRHSFISFKLALTRDAAAVASEAGTSVEKINSNYRELVTPDEAKRWFTIEY